MSNYETSEALTPEDLDALKWPFEARDHKFDRGMIYLSEFPICARLDEIDPAWSWEITSVTTRPIVGTKDSISVTVVGGLTIKGVTRYGVGSAAALETKPRTDKDTGETYTEEANEPEKGAATDALKRAARLFGVGRYLLKVPKDIKTMDALEQWLNAAIAAKQGHNGH